MWRSFIDKMKLRVLQWTLLVVASNLILSVCVLLSLSTSKMDAPFLTKASADNRNMDTVPDRQQPLETNAAPGFVFHDLPLPGWARGYRMPLAGVEISKNADLLPGAARGYRNGSHEGVDLYCTYGTPVLAAKDGYVLGTGADYHELPKVLRVRLLEIAKNLLSTAFRGY